MRSEVVSDWLSNSEWATWRRHAMTGDASARRYERLTNDNGTHVILMDAPPETCGSQARFVEIAIHLKGIDLNPPDILAWDEALGLMILEDLGPTDFAQHLRVHPNEEAHLYEVAVDVLNLLAATPPPKDLTTMTPAIGADMLDLAFEWAAQDQSALLEDDIKQEMIDLLSSVSPDPQTLSLRDFHAENLIWRPQNSVSNRVGLLDFQDAFVTHPTYDLASLLRDARRDVDPSLVTPMLTRLSGKEDMRAAFHIHAVQRNLRILGIFERLARRDAKTGYLELVPRVRGHLRADLAAPEMGRIAPLIEQAFNLGEDTKQ